MHANKIIIGPIATAYGTGQTDYKIGLRLSVCLSVCEHSHVRISLSIFTKIGTDVRTPKGKTSSSGGQYCTTSFPILPQTPLLCQEVLKTQRILSNPTPTSALSGPHNCNKTKIKVK